MSVNELERYFIYKCKKGFGQRNLPNNIEYQDRLNFEIKTILSMGFPGYFLIVQDMVNWAKNNNIYIGLGRGSAAGSLVSFCLNITGIDPIKYNLLFERFLNPDRVGSPNITTKELTFKEFNNKILPTIDKDIDIDYH